MNWVEFIIALLFTLFAWIANEVIYMFREQPEQVFSMHIYATDDPIVSRTHPGYGYARTGDIYGGTFELGDGPVFADGSEWWSIRISPFSPHWVWIDVDYNKMTTTIIKQDKFFSFGASKLWH